MQGMLFDFLTKNMKPKTSPAQKVIAVLGMHRSGTSCLIGSLQAAGLFLGKHNTWNDHNLKGNRENDDIVKLNDELLVENGGSWKNPPAAVNWSKKHLKRAREIIASYHDHEMWGFKDPRTLLTLAGWKKLIPDMLLIGIFRHPLAVARSLQNRGSGIGVEIEKAFDLWSHYNRILLREYKQNPFPVISFDWDQKVLHEKLNGLLLDLELNRIDPENGFFSPDLRHHMQLQEDSVPPSCWRLYRELQAICL